MWQEKSAFKMAAKMVCLTSVRDPDMSQHTQHAKNITFSTSANHNTACCKNQQVEV